MNKEYVIRMISTILSNTLYREKDILHSLEKEEGLDITAYQDVTNGDVNGCIRWNHLSFSFCSSVVNNEHTLIVGDLNTNEMSVFKGSQSPTGEVEFAEVELGGSVSNGIIDLNAEGRRWEGGLLDGAKPHGFGRYYDEEGCLESE